MGELVILKLQTSKHRLRLDLDCEGHFVQIFPPPSFPCPRWRFDTYEQARRRAEMLSDKLNIKIHDAIRPPFLEQFR